MIGINLKKRLKENRVTGAVGAVGAVLLGLLLLIPVRPDLSPLGSGLIRLSFDFPFRFSSRLTNQDEVVIVYLDEASYATLGQVPGSPWHRSLHAQLLRRLTECGAREVAFDVLMDEPWKSIAGTNLAAADEQLNKAILDHPYLRVDRVKIELVDQHLGAAIRAASNVVLAAKIYFDKDEDGIIHEQIRGPWPGIVSNSLWGVTDLPIDAGEIPAIRRHYFNPERPEYTNFAWVAAEALGKAPPDLPMPRYLNYYGPRGTLAHVSYHRVLDPTGVSPERFANKIVFVGMDLISTSQGRSRDDFATPYTRWTGETTQGVEIQATAFLNLIRNEWLSELSPLSEVLILSGFGVLFGYGLLLVRPSSAVGLALLGFAAIAGGSLALVWYSRVWFPWLLSGAAQIPATLAWAVFWNTRRLYLENKTLEERLSTRAEAEGPTLPISDEASSLDRETLQSAPQIHDHQILRRIGKGGYGEVWLARDVIGGFHAVKIISRSDFPSDEPFNREFKGIQKFTPISRSHPGLVHVLQVGRNDRAGYFYYIMEAGDDESDGQNIDPSVYSPNDLAKQIAKRGRLSLAQSLKLGLDLTSALDYLHQQQLIHRDIKPSNVIFVKGEPKIADIGLVTDIVTAGRNATFLGTPGYIPPEGPGTPAADVFSLGVVLYQASIGRDLSHFPLLPTTCVEWSDYRWVVKLHRIITKACEENVRVRYRTMTEMRADLLLLNDEIIRA